MDNKVENRTCFVDLSCFLHLFLLCFKWFPHFRYIFMLGYCFMF